MTAALMSISGFANAWAQAMLRATWQGGLALVLAWALCQTVARRSGRAQSWIWRLAFLKFAACLLLLAPLSLPLLPTPQQRSQPIAASIPTLPPPAPAAATALPQQTRASSPGAPSSPPASLLSPPSLVRPFWLLIPWCIGVLCVLVPFSLGYRDSRRLRRSGTPFANPHLTAMYSDLAGKFLIRPPPVLLSTASPLAPLLAQLGADLPGPTQLALKAGSHEVRQALGTVLGEIRQAAKAEDPRHQAKPAPANDLP